MAKEFHLRTVQASEYNSQFVQKTMDVALCYGLSFRVKVEGTNLDLHEVPIVWTIYVTRQDIGESWSKAVTEMMHIMNNCI